MLRKLTLEPETRCLCTARPGRGDAWWAAVERMCPLEIGYDPSVEALFCHLITSASMTMELEGAGWSDLTKFTLT